MEEKKKTLSKDIAIGAVIAALYAALTLVLAPISYGPIQLRISEALTVLPAFSSAAVPGLFVGCLISNAVGTAMGQTSLIDIVLGSAATLIAASLSRVLRSNKWLVPAPPVIINALIIGAQIKWLYTPEVPLFVCMAYVGIGQLVACYGLGMPLHYFASKERSGKRQWDRWTNQ